MVQELAEVQQEGASVVQLLQQRHAGLSTALGQHFPEMRNTIWQSKSSMQAAAPSLTPQMTENNKKVRWDPRAFTMLGCCPNVTQHVQYYACLVSRAALILSECWQQGWSGLYIAQAI